MREVPAELILLDCRTISFSSFLPLPLWSLVSMIIRNGGRAYHSLCQNSEKPVAFGVVILFLTIVSLSMNNPEELNRTLTSISVQTEVPHRVLVLDGSDSRYQPVVKAIAKHFNAYYRWETPRGIYHAMNTALAVVPDQSYVWFLNSGDWLSSRTSVEKMMGSLGKLDEFEWAVGDTLSIDSKRVSIGTRHRNPPPTRIGIRTRDFWFPHPSTVARASALKASGGFDERFIIAADYLMSLRLFEVHGKPRLVAFPVTVHNLDGVSGTPSIRGMIEGSMARLRTFGLSQAVFEPALIVLRLTWGLLSRLTSAVTPLSQRRRMVDSVSDWPHICTFTEMKNWPDCCEEFLKHGGIQGEKRHLL